MKIERKPLIWFLAISFGLAWILFVLPLAFRQGGNPPSQLVYTLFWSLAMWAPGLGALLATRYVAGEPLRTLNLGRLGDKRAYLWAWLLPPALAIVTGLLTLAFGAGQLDLQFTLIKQAMANAPGAQAFPAWLVVAIQSAIALTIGPLFNTLFALGEELGWRGFLLPRLLPLGQWPAIVLSGAIWGAWHAPAILQGHNYPGRPVAGVFMMIVFCVLVGAILSWLYLRTRSPWAPALAHGSLNATAGLPILFLTGVDISIGGTVASLIGWIPLVLFVAWLIGRGVCRSPKGWLRQSRCPGRQEALRTRPIPLRILKTGMFHVKHPCFILQDHLSSPVSGGGPRLQALPAGGDDGDTECNKYYQD